MRRAELKALGWSFDRMSGSRHEVWRHPTNRHLLILPCMDLLNEYTAARLLEQAER